MFGLMGRGGTDCNDIRFYCLNCIDVMIVGSIV